VSSASRLLAATLAFAASIALAQTNANEEAKQLAQRLGRERNAEGLQAIVDARNRELLEWYERGWRTRSEKEPDVPVPEAIEAIIVKNYRDPVVGAQLRTLVSANWTPYRSRELFDLMFEEWRTGKERPAMYPIREGIFRTSLPGIEPVVLAWLAEDPGPGEYDANAIMAFLSKRKYPPAVPMMAKRLAAKGAGEGITISSWLIEMESPEALAVLRERIAWLDGRTGGASERKYIAEAIADLPAKKERRIAQARQLDLAKRRAALRAPVDEAMKLRESDPNRYVEAMERYLREGAPLLQPGEVQLGWLHLGNFVRFRQRDPRRAIEIYGRAEQAGQGLAIFLQGDTWQFDLHDKARAIEAYRRNLAAVAGDPANHDRGQREFFDWAQRWLQHQIAYLETGRTFSGAVGREDVAGVGMLMYLGMGEAFDDGIRAIGPPDVARKLAALPASAWVLMRTATVLPLLPDARSVLAHLARNDPAGYATAGFFALVDLAERESKGGPRGDKLGFADSEVLKQAKGEFLRSRRITLLP
jgi:hypothetical protein